METNRFVEYGIHEERRFISCPSLSAKPESAHTQSEHLNWIRIGLMNISGAEHCFSFTVYNAAHFSLDPKCIHFSVVVVFAMSAFYREEEERIFSALKSN